MTTANGTLLLTYDDDYMTHKKIVMMRSEWNEMKRKMMDSKKVGDHKKEMLCVDKISIECDVCVYHKIIRLKIDWRSNA